MIKNSTKSTLKLLLAANVFIIAPSHGCSLNSNQNNYSLFLGSMTGIFLLGNYVVPRLCAERLHFKPTRSEKSKVIESKQQLLNATITQTLPQTNTNEFKNIAPVITGLIPLHLKKEDFTRYKKLKRAENIAHASIVSCLAFSLYNVGKIAMPNGTLS